MSESLTARFAGLVAVRGLPPDIRRKLPCLLETTAEGSRTIHRHNPSRAEAACDRPNPTSRYENTTLGEALEYGGWPCDRPECSYITEHLTALERSPELPGETPRVLNASDLPPQYRGKRPHWVDGP